MRKNARIAVTGIGTVSAVGSNNAAFLNALSTGTSNFGPSIRHELAFDSVVCEASEECFQEHGHDELDSPTGRLCLAAAHECINNAHFSDAGKPDGLILGTSTGGQAMSEAAILALVDGKSLPSYNYRGQGSIASPARLVARDLDIRGPVQTLSTACTSAANAIAMAIPWLCSGRCNRVLAGGGDALCYTTLTIFHLLELTGPAMCTPFHQDRKGMTLADGAGFLLLERLDDVVARNQTPIAELYGAGMSSDAHHMTAPPEDGAGAELAMRRALISAGIEPADIDHINAHGTGTKLNDKAEARAINRVFGKDVPVMSCKGLTGHAIGGAGGIEAVASIYSVIEGRAFANAGASEPASDCPVSLVPAGGLQLGGSPVIISNSFAFGGNNISLVFGTPREVR